MRVERQFTESGKDPYARVPFRTSTSEIRNPDGSIVFRLEGFRVPEAWSQVAGDVIAQKYFRRAGIPARLKRVEENSVPSWLWRSVPDEAALAELPENERDPGETDSRQVFDRLVLRVRCRVVRYVGRRIAASVVGDDAVATSERLHLRRPALRAAPELVGEHEWEAAASLAIFDPDISDDDSRHVAPRMLRAQRTAGVRRRRPMVMGSMR